MSNTHEFDNAIPVTDELNIAAVHVHGAHESFSVIEYQDDAFVPAVAIDAHTIINGLESLSFDDLKQLSEILKSMATDAYVRYLERVAPTWSVKTWDNVYRGIEEIDGVLETYGGYTDVIDDTLIALRKELVAVRDAEKVEKQCVGRQRPGHIYVLYSAGYYKIGRTNNLKNRFNQFQTKYPHPVETVFTVEVDNMIASEKALHEMYAERRVHGEWFDLSPQDVEAIKAYLEGVK